MLPVETPDIDDALDDAQDAARRVGDHPALEALARWGFVVNGLLHLVIGYLALRVAHGAGGAQADQSGALAQLSSTPFGMALMWALVLGLLALVLWQVTVVVAPDAGDGPTGRVKAAARAVVYLAIAFTAGQFGTGTGSSGSSEEASQDVTAQIMQVPTGRWLIGAVGLAVVAVGAYHVLKGVARRFLTDLEDDPGLPVTVAGVVGYVAKGVVLVLAGGLFVLAAWEHQAHEADGLDGALKTVRDQPFGPWLLVLVGAGIIAFGVYCFGRARHQRI